VADSKGAWELYDLAADGTELSNRIEDEIEKAEELRKHFDAWAKRTGLNSKKKKK
jgi:hypothetical protein